MNITQSTACIDTVRAYTHVNPRTRACTYVHTTAEAVWKHTIPILFEYAQHAKTLTHNASVDYLHYAAVKYLGLHVFYKLCSAIIQCLAF